MPPAAINYLVPPPGYFWHWAADGSAVEWEDDNTICLWMELHALLHYLAPLGLPPLGSVLLVLMACHHRHTAALMSVQAFAANSSGGDQVSSSAKSLIKRLGNVLESIAALPEELRTGLPARAHLLTTLFEAVPNQQQPDSAAGIMLQIDTWGLDQLLPQQPRLTGHARLLRDLKALAAVHERLDLTNLAARLRTGIDAVNIHPATLPEPPREPGESLLPLLRQLELQSDHELASLAAAARRIVAMFTLPRPAGFPQELPVGGISDITNRGALDRLLPSELAAEDALLMARLANNEALYFRRDSPPDEPASERLILMDTGIQLWGLPRLYALAAALGLSSNAGSDRVQILRREGGMFHPLTLETVAQVQTCLQDLYPDPHAALALESFSPELEAGTRPDVFFLTGDSPRPAVREALHTLAIRLAALGGRFYVLSISRSGALELGARSRAGTRVISTGRLDPGEILRSPTGTKPDKPTPSLTDLPSIIRHLDFYRQNPLPFRFPSTPHPGSNWHPFAHWHVNVDTSRRLMLWETDSSLAPGEIAAGLPEARAYQVGSHSEEWIVISSGKHPGDRAEAVCIGMKEPTRRQFKLASSHPYPVWMRCQNGAAILGYTEKAEACSLTDGTLLHHLDLPRGTKPETVTFNGKTLALSAGPSPATGNSPVPKPARDPASLNFPPVMGAPVSAGFVASGTLVIRAQGGRWELTMPELIFAPSLKSQLSGVRPFRRVEPDTSAMAEGPAFYLAEWHADCRMIFDSRGLLHLIFADQHGRLQISLLALTGKPVAAWIAPWPKPQAGNPDWLLKPDLPNLSPPVNVVPLLQRFATMARDAAPHLEPADILEISTA